MRQVYLDTVWSLDPFPLATPGKLHGRLFQYDKHGITLLTRGAEEKFSLEETLMLAANFTASECLLAGDIIEVDLEDKKIIGLKLLVPTLIENPLDTSFDFKTAKLWTHFCNCVRDYFVKKEFTELRTPTLVVSPGLEPFLDPFSTELRYGKKSRELFLPTSPEFHLKKALTLGFEKCFELKECFRNGELSSTHFPEFLMLEWYRAFESLDVIMDDIQNLLVKLQRELTPTEPVYAPQIIKMETLWKEVLNFDLTPQTTLEDLKTLGQTDDDFDDLFNLIFLEKIEPVLKARLNPTIVWHYPPSQKALARLTNDGWADRFELYWRGLELANAFHELNDAKEQRLRFLKDQEKKKALGKKIIPVDEEFLRALEWGMPPSSGVAIGMERVFMCLFKLKDIRECRLFSGACV